MAQVTTDAVHSALDSVLDPEIGKPITELGMVGPIDIRPDGSVDVTVLLTISGCPMQDAIRTRVTEAVSAVAGVTAVLVRLETMSEEQRKNLRDRLSGPVREIPFNRPGSLTRCYAVTSGKGGVGKSSITVNIAVSLASRGLAVGVLDSDIYGHSVPGMLGIKQNPTVVDGMLMPPSANGVKAISMLPFKPGGSTEPVAFRGPMLHRAVEQFLTDVYWGDLDVLLLDLPPGTGDVPISVAQLLPSAELLVVTTPQSAAAEVAVRAGMLAKQTHQKIVGVVENMSAFPCPHCGEPIELFGTGGGKLVAETLSQALGANVPLIGQVPFDVRLREGGDSGEPLVAHEPQSQAARALDAIADQLADNKRGLVGMDLGMTPVGR
ncbi:MAG: Mrp/NBP35 family ATP-binding protein [Candidatus Nanopelagicales bacterium]|nr:Mrp/NBP35 family ATP-binding protein [Candidatus Nanopelagicales bacterium]MDZ4249486.1 Mrp/NBP35 family ATP-binding protein [Candidatus Nanopelagicales bacterium]